MKTRYLLVGSAAVLSLTLTTALGQPLDFESVLKNQAVASSPRAREVFPWLTREVQKSVASTRSSDSQTALAEVTKNRALAASPRTLEQFPELLRPAQAPRQSQGSSVPASVAKNRAMLSSPRTLEQYPELARGGTFGLVKTNFEVAPVK